MPTNEEIQNQNPDRFNASAAMLNKYFLKQIAVKTLVTVAFVVVATAIAKKFLDVPDEA